MFIRHLFEYRIPSEPHTGLSLRSQKSGQSEFFNFSKIFKSFDSKISSSASAASCTLSSNSESWTTSLTRHSPQLTKRNVESAVQYLVRSRHGLPYDWPLDA